MEKGIEFEVTGIAQVIKHHRLKVPPNQREYSWNADEQVMDFLKDIANAVRHKQVPYFLGTIVLTKGANNVLEIADGQQRLATTTMILAAIRDWFRAKGQQMMIQSIENDFLFTIDRNASERVPKLTLNLDDNEFFKNSILHPPHDRSLQAPQRRSHKLIAQAFETIKLYIKNLESNGSDYVTEHLKDWMDYLEGKANVVMLSVSNAENAFKMFETLNDRGLKTSQVDLVKNHLFSKADDRLPEAQRLWSSMKGAVESVADDDDVTIEFLRCACCLLAGPTTKKDIMTVLKEQTPSKTEAIRIMTLLEELSKEYAAILNPDNHKWNDYDASVRKSISAINLLGVTQIRPLMMAVSKYFAEKHTGITFRKFVAWSVRFLIMNIRGGRLDEAYGRIARKIYTRDLKNETDLTKEIGNLLVSDSEFKSAFETVKIGTAKLARYYLRSLETTAKGELDAEFLPNDNAGAVNLEHILPESANEHWPHLQPSDIDSHWKRLGNLALMAAVKNNNIGNLPFTDKKEVYKGSDYLLTSKLADYEKWGIEEIEARQKDMAGLAVKTWQL